MTGVRQSVIDYLSFHVLMENIKETSLCRMVCLYTLWKYLYYYYYYLHRVICSPQSHSTAVTCCTSREDEIIYFQ